MNFNSILKKIDDEPLSKSLPMVLRLSKSIGESDLEKWVKLELNGYFNTNPALTDEVVVPEFRTVTGQHSDDYGRPLVIKDHKLAFVNTTRTRYGVADLERMLDENFTCSYRDALMSEIIKNNLDVEVSIFSFHTRQFAGVLSGIKAELSERLMAIKGQIEDVETDLASPPQEDVIELKPNFFGLGLNLNALLRRWQEFQSKRK